MCSLQKSVKTGQTLPKQTRERKWLRLEEEVVKAGVDPGEIRLWLLVAGLFSSGGRSLHGSHPAGHSLDSSGWRLARYAAIGTSRG